MANTGMKNLVQHLRYNQDAACIIACLQNGGFKIFNVDPLCQKLSVKKDVGKLESAEMLFRSNLVALVGAAPAPEARGYAPCQTVTLWDESAGPEAKRSKQLLFPQPVIAVRLQRDRLIVVLRNQVHVYTLPGLEKLTCLDTGDNPHGICEVSPFGRTLVFPHRKTNQIQVINMDSLLPNESASPVILDAHRHCLGCLAVDARGALVASASIHGTIIRVFDVVAKKKVAELRRGSDSAKVYSIAFSPDSAYLCAASNKGTVHVFALKDLSLNKQTLLKKVGMVEGDRCLAKFEIAYDHYTICAFGKGNTVITASADGTFKCYIFCLDGRVSCRVINNFLLHSEDMGDDYDL